MTYEERRLMVLRLTKLYDDCAELGAELEGVFTPEDCAARPGTLKFYANALFYMRHVKRDLMTLVIPHDEEPTP